MKHNKRVLLKISGEALEWTRDHWIDPIFYKKFSNTN